MFRDENRNLVQTDQPSIKIKLIDYDTVLPIWQNELWPTRTSIIEPCSAIIYGTVPFEYDIEYMDQVPYCIGAYVDGELAGINTGHETGESFTSRGLFVFAKYRGKGIAKRILQKTCELGKEAGAKFIWTMPRSTSLPVYESVGFRRSTKWFPTETSPRNCYARLDY